jgi:hypothetical protein
VTLTNVRKQARYRERHLGGSALPKSCNPFHAGEWISGLPRFTHLLPVCLPPCTDPTSFPAVGSFYYQASNGSVALPIAGYNYNSDWTNLLVGLSPTGTAASLAAPRPPT